MPPRRRFALLSALALVLVAQAARADLTTVDFNDLNFASSYDPGATFPAGPAPGTGSYDNGWDLKGGFTSRGVSFANSYNATYHSWSGWSYSNVNDPTTTGVSPLKTDYSHQYAAITGSAPGGSGNYGISSGTGAYINLAAGTAPVSFQVTNTTYSYLSMTLGDGFAKKFGVGDSFELKIYGYSGANGTGTRIGEVDFYLANYTSSSSLPVSVWTLVDLSSLGGARSLGFDYASSDVGQFGINTPEYFAMDDLIVSSAAVPEPSSALLTLAGVATLGLAARRRRGIATR